MKLVELLARELSEWPESAVCITQDDSSYLYAWNEMRPEYRECSWYSPDGKDLGMHDAGLQEEEIALASDQKKSIVTRAQWQAERDRQKGGEWKRHRGRKIPVSAESVVDVKLDTGEVMSGEIAGDWEWSHTDAVPRIMQYRIISQPQAEEVEVKDTTIGTLSLKVEVDTSDATQAIDDLAAKWDQIETPFKWRDEVTELNAYIEKYTRERDALIERLASEGFALIPPVVSVVSEFSGVDMSDWRNWKAGDIVECVTSEYAGTYDNGKQYIVEWVNDDGFSVYDNYGGNSSCGWFDHDADGLKFIRRP